MTFTEAKFSVGELVIHRLFGYRGVIYDIDPVFLGTDEWYDKVALTRPPRNKPWYRVLVDNAFHETYVAEQNLQTDDSGERVSHPMIEAYFDRFENGRYLSVRTRN